MLNMALNSYFIFVSSILARKNKGLSFSTNYMFSLSFETMQDQPKNEAGIKTIQLG